MKRISKFLSVFLAIAMAVSATTTVVSAASTDSYQGSSLSQPFQKEIYDALETNALNGTANHTINLVDQPNMDQAADDAIVDAIIAFLEDHPEIYWVSKTGAFTYAPMAVGPLPTNILAVQVDFGIANAKNAADDNKIATAVGNILAAASAKTSDYDKLLAIHDGIANKIVYFNGATSPEHHEITGLGNGSGVCESYSKAFKYIADKAGFNVVTVAGVGETAPGVTEAHMWNLVELEGDWYAVDVTWDDNNVTGVPEPTNFLVGANTVATGGRTFSATHIADSEPFNSINLDYPMLAAEKYVPSGVTPPVTPPTVPNSDDNSSSGGGGGGGSSSSSKADAVTGFGGSATTVAKTTDKNVNADGTVKPEGIVKEIKAAKNDQATSIKIKDASKVDEKATAQILASMKATKAPITIVADTTAAGSKKVEGRITLTEQVLTAMPKGMNLKVEANEKAVKTVREAFAKKYSNQAVAITTAQKGSIAAMVRIAVKVDLSKLNTKNLQIYVLDSVTNQYVKVQNPNYVVDNNGYLHFDTNMMGSIIVTDTPLATK